MKEGLLWYDDSAQDLAEKVGPAVWRYRQKFGVTPEVCYVHPSTLVSTDGKPIDGKVVAVGRLQVAGLATVLRHHFWLGREERKKGRGTRG